MRTHGVYFSTNEEYELVALAAKMSREKSESSYIAEAVRQRMRNEGFIPASPDVQIMLRVHQIGHEKALKLLSTDNS